MSVKFACPSCQHPMKVGDAYAGRTIVCTQCEQKIKVPGAAADATAGGKPAAASAGKKGAQPAGEKKAAKPPAEEDELELLDFDELSERKDSRPGKPGRAGGGKSAPKAGGKGKKKGKKNDAPEGVPLPILIASVFGALLLLGAGAGGLYMANANGLFAASKKEIPVPQNWTPVKVSEKSYSCLQPEGFELNHGGGTGGIPPFATFTKGSVKLDFHSSIGDSARGSIAQSSSGGFGEAAVDENGNEIDLAPVRSLHDSILRKFEDKYSNYTEELPQKVETKGFGEGRVSDFAYNTTFGGTMRGVRGTVLGVEWSLTITCECKPHEFEAYRPVFIKWIESLSQSG